MWDFSEIAPDRAHVISRKVYEAMAEAGMFGDAGVELLRGVIVDMSPQSFAHARVIALLNELLVLKLHGRATTLPLSPYAAADDSLPEPDLYLVAGSNKLEGDYPSEALLVVEVAVSSLKKDLGLKASLYAEAKVPEYWVVDVDKKRVIVHTAPANGHYAQKRECTTADSITLVSFPDTTFACRDFLP